jgi:FkbM family methyltransferase
MNPPIINLRSFSDDQFWLDKVFYSNSYNIRGIKDQKDATTIVDLGAHCGYFAFTALALGAKKVYSVEPFIENFKVLLKNVGDNYTIVTHNLAIGRENGCMNFAYPKPQKSHLMFGHIQECTQDADKCATAPSVTLDYYLSNFVPETKIDILKINIGGQERDILKSSVKSLERVESICGETYLEPENVPSFKSEMAALGFIKSHVVSNKEEENIISFIFSKTEIEKYYNL